MADFTALKTAIQTYIKQNGNEEITGEKLQEILLSMVTTLGDSAINDLVTALANEVAARQNADGTLQQHITNEATARGNADTALSDRLGSTITAENTAADQIGAEAEARAAADTALQNLIDGITDNIANGYVYAGIATPSSTPATGKVFYLALTAGTYTNFGNIEVSQGINILKYNGSAWSLDAFIGIDDELTPGSNNLPKSGNVLENIIKNGSAFDLSAYNAVDGVLATYAGLDAALTALNALPAVYKQGGMSFRFVRTSDNKYVQYRLMSDTFSTNESDWQGVDDKPIDGGKNLFTSGGAEIIARKSYKKTETFGYSASENYKLLELDGSVGIGNDGYWVSDFISLDAVKSLIFTGASQNTHLIVAFYDSNKDYISNSGVVGTNGNKTVTYTKEQLASYKYIRVHSWDSTHQLIITFDSVATDLESVGNELTNSISEIEDIEGIKFYPLTIFDDSRYLVTSNLVSSEELDDAKDIINIVDNQDWLVHLSDDGETWHNAIPAGWTNDLQTQLDKVDTTYFRILVKVSQVGDVRKLTSKKSVSKEDLEKYVSGGNITASNIVYNGGSLSDTTNVDAALNELTISQFCFEKINVKNGTGHFLWVPFEIKKDKQFLFDVEAEGNWALFLSDSDDYTSEDKVLIGNRDLGNNISVVTPSKNWQGFIFWSQSQDNSDTLIVKFRPSEKIDDGVTIRVAAYNSSEDAKRLADYTCDGVNDEVELQAALDKINERGSGTLILAVGDYKIDSFMSYDNTVAEMPTALLIKSNTKSIEITGDVLPHAYSDSAPVIHITNNALSNLFTQSSVIASQIRLPNRIGVKINRLGFIGADKLHPVIIINGRHFGFIQATDLYIMNDGYQNFNVYPAKGSVGLRCPGGDDDGTGQRLENVIVRGFYEGFQLGGEHIVGMGLLGRECVYGYTFGNYPYWYVSEHESRRNAFAHPIVLINCGDEHNVCLPLFNRSGEWGGNGAGMQDVEMYGFSMELWKSWGTFYKRSREIVPGAFCGKIMFSANGYSTDGISGSNVNQKDVQFFESGSGSNFEVVNSTNKKVGTRVEMESYFPQYGQYFYCTDDNKLYICKNQGEHSVGTITILSDAINSGKITISFGIMSEDFEITNASSMVGKNAIAEWISDSLEDRGWKCSVSNNVITLYAGTAAAADTISLVDDSESPTGIEAQAVVTSIGRKPVFESIT